MKKQLLLLLFFTSLLSISNAQDILIKRNGDELKCKVLEIDSSRIKYRLNVDSNSASVVTDEILKTDVFMIRYSNGAKDVFTDYEKKKAPVRTANLGNIRVSEKYEITNEGKKFYIQSQVISQHKLMQLLRSEKDKKINALLTKYVICTITSPVLKFGSIPLAVVGILLFSDAAFNPYQTDQDTKFNGAAFLSGFALGQIGGYTLEYFQYKNLKAAVKLYNDKLNKN